MECYSVVALRSLMENSEANEHKEESDKVSVAHIRDTTISY